MAKLNTNSNAYTIIYACILVIIVAFLLAFVASALKPTQDANVELDKKKQILASLNLRGDSVKDVSAEYNKVIKLDPIYDNVKGRIKAENGGFSVANKDITNENLPLYIAEVKGETKIVVPMTGAGLWGGLSGYISVDIDGTTVYGSYFDHESETAGLGARIKETWFQESFNGKTIFDKENVILGVYKKGKAPARKQDCNVDAVTGATLTSNGVHDMIQKSFTQYKAAIDAFKGSESAEGGKCCKDETDCCTAATECCDSTSTNNQN